MNEPKLDPDFQALLAGGGARNAQGLPLKSSAAPIADPTQGMSAWQRGLAGVGQGMTDLVRHAGNIVGLESDQDLVDARAQDAPLLNTTAGKVGQFIGQTAALAPVGMGAGAALGRMGAVGARFAGNPLASGAVQGATQGAVMADPGERMQGAALGGLSGAALPAAAMGLSKLASGVTRTPEAQALLDRGIDLTMGQMNPRGIANRMEQAMEGTLGIGDMLQNAREAPMAQYSRVTLEDAMPPGQRLTNTSGDFNDMIQEASQKFDSAYQGAKGYPVGAKIMQVKGPDIPLTQAIQQVADKPRIGLTPDARSSWGQQLTDQLQETINAAKKSGGMQSDHLIAYRSAIRDAIRGEAGTDNASRAAKGLLQDAADKVTQAIDSQLPPDAASALRQTDQQYAKFSVLRNAAASAKDAPGGPTRYQISTAISKATPQSVYASGGGFNRDLSKAATETFQNNVPRTGLAGVGRLGAAAALLGPVAMTHPLALAPLAGGAALNLTAPGRRALAGNTAWQKSLQQGLLGVQGAVPAKVRNLPGLYGRSGLLGLEAQRLQQEQ